MDSYTYNELASGACEDAKDTFLEEELGYWFSGPGVPHETFPPEPRRTDADAWTRDIRALKGSTRRATEEEWKVYANIYTQAVSFASRYVGMNWDPNSESQNHYDEVCEAVVAQLEEGNFKVDKDPKKALLRACKLVLAIEANPEQNPTETVRFSPNTREQILAAVRAAE